MIQGRDIGTSLPINIKDFLKINGDFILFYFFFREVEGLLMKYVLRQEGLTQLHRLHHNVYGVNIDDGLYSLLYRRL